ncbi:hypothetical protein AMES_0314 [Amycolatopsis mediterranei S699]|uniref:Uncharacterized protein n=2 Tax=Amycolatopsis mediterranei TaxID=33910 RepID=A0A0H3CU29_AMYMU|nr:DUF4383 domain-containing protein [Amycolatopsis mediterranei]ADJ42142.1 conserved hypothetical protein [Amycolatopsis mediterranei U32]AEK38818.1 hypothetical protein RAM_01615 [Amycolatopsis mediterranei S699]AFO73850.1 hypothetical protein AMES_0314 [Amycolatopsis mediterranei S699]AGT80979.1 hypothetical protein B737_0315 [Amycolatopsis mediterranei RB]KDO08975.1 hypothetical protein DV26_21450 [Amycolatopsis mediterranei]
MVHAKGARIRVRGLQPAQVLAGLAGIAFLVVGIIGFSRTGFGNFAGHHDAGFWRFSANPLMSLVRVVTGVVGLLFAFGSGRARAFGWLLFIGYGLLFVWGLMIDGLISTNPFANAGNPLDIGRADTWLHLGIAALGLLIAVLPARRTILLPEDETVDEPVVAEQRTEVIDRTGRTDRTDRVGPVDRTDRIEADRVHTDRVNSDQVTEEPRRRSFLRRDHKGRGPEVTREERPPGLAH